MANSKNKKDVHSSKKTSSQNSADSRQKEKKTGRIFEWVGILVAILGIISWLAGISW